MKRQGRPSAGTTKSDEFEKELARRVQSNIEKYVFNHIYLTVNACIRRYYSEPVDVQKTADFPQAVLAASKVFSGNGRYKLHKPKWATELAEFLEDLKARYRL